MSRASRAWARQPRSLRNPTSDSGANNNGEALNDMEEVSTISPTSLTVPTNMNTHNGHMRKQTFTGTIDSTATTLDGNNATDADNHHLSSSTIVPKSPFSTQTIHSACSTEGFFYPPLSPTSKGKSTSGNATSPKNATNEKRGFFHSRSRTKSQVKAEDVLQDVNSRSISTLHSSTIHPYQLAAYTSPLADEGNSGGGGYAEYRKSPPVRLNHLTTISEPSEPSEKSPPLTRSSSKLQHHHLSPKQQLDVLLPPQRDPQHRLSDAEDTPASPSSPEFVTQIRTYFLLFLLLAIAPLLSTLYLVTGHAIFHTSSSFRHPPVPLSSSARVGAVGGIILAIPIILLLYLTVNPAWLSLTKLRSSLLSRRTLWSSGPEPEDFFEDDGMSEIGKETYWVWCTIVVLVSIVLGAASGPLGVTCLAGNGEVLLSVVQAAKAGLVGAAVIFGSVLVLGILVVLIIADIDRVQRDREMRMNGPPVSDL